MRDLLLQLYGHLSDIRCVAFSPDGKTLVSGSSDNLILWETTIGCLINKLEGHASDINSLAFSMDGMTLISGSRDKTIIL